MTINWAPIVPVAVGTILGATGPVWVSILTGRAARRQAESAAILQRNVARETELRAGLRRCREELFLMMAVAGRYLQAGPSRSAEVQLWDDAYLAAVMAPEQLLAASRSSAVRATLDAAVDLRRQVGDLVREDRTDASTRLDGLSADLQTLMRLLSSQVDEDCQALFAAPKR